jgi:hypothetical protein
MAQLRAGTIHIHFLIVFFCFILQNGEFLYYVSERLSPVGGEWEKEKERRGRRKRRTILICSILRALIGRINCIIVQQMYFNFMNVILLYPPEGIPTLA